MNILLWILQILLALWNIIGGVYMINNYKIVASPWALNTLPKSIWIILGILQIVLALGLILPGLVGKQQKLIALSAGCLAVLSLLGIVLYAAYTGFPGIFWGVLPAIVTAFVAYGRMEKR